MIILSIRGNQQLFKCIQETEVAIDRDDCSQNTSVNGIHINETSMVAEEEAYGEVFFTPTTLLLEDDTRRQIYCTHPALVARLTNSKPQNLYSPK